jgi:uncharacterized membrane protein YhaH (DUF805 family)
MSLTDLIFVVDLFKRAPRFMRKSVVGLDVFGLSTEDVAESLSRCFSSTTLGLPEIGIGSAEEDVVVQAWELYFVLMTTAKTKRSWAHGIYTTSVVMSSLAVVFAVFAGALEELEKGDKRSEMMAWMHTKVLDDSTFVKEVMSIGVLVLPLVSSAITALNSRLRYLPKSGVMYACAAQIIREIYKFRLRVGDYQAEMSTSGRGGRRQHWLPARKRFTQRVQSLFKQVMDSEMALDALMIESTTSPMLDKRRDQIKINLERRAGKIMEQCGPTLQGVDEDDMYTSLRLDTYIEYRVSFLLAELRKSLPHLVMLNTRFEVLGLIFASVGTLLSVYNNEVWVGLTVLFCTICRNIPEYLLLTRRITVTNGALRDLRNVQIWWKSLGAVERNTKAAATYAVTLCEDAALRVVLAWAGEQTGNSNEQEQVNKSGGSAASGPDGGKNAEGTTGK